MLVSYRSCRFLFFYFSLVYCLVGRSISTSTERQRHISHPCRRTAYSSSTYCTSHINRSLHLYLLCIRCRYNATSHSRAALQFRHFPLLARANTPRRRRITLFSCLLLVVPSNCLRCQSCTPSHLLVHSTYVGRLSARPAFHCSQHAVAYVAPCASKHCRGAC